MTVDSLGHVSGTTAVAKSDITALGIPAQDTTYSAATTSAAGLMSAADKTKLNGLSAPTVTSDIPLKFSINANGGLTITYDDGKWLSGFYKN